MDQLRLSAFMRPISHSVRRTTTSVLANVHRKPPRLRVGPFISSRSDPTTHVPAAVQIAGTACHSFIDTRSRPTPSQP